MHAPKKRERHVQVILLDGIFMKPAKRQPPASIEPGEWDYLFSTAFRTAQEEICTLNKPMVCEFMQSGNASKKTQSLQVVDVDCKSDRELHFLLRFTDKTSAGASVIDEEEHVEHVEIADDQQSSYCAHAVLFSHEGENGVKEWYCAFESHRHIRTGRIRGALAQLLRDFSEMPAHSFEVEGLLFGPLKGDMLLARGDLTTLSVTTRTSYEDSINSRAGTIKESHTVRFIPDEGSIDRHIFSKIWDRMKRLPIREREALVDIDEHGSAGDTRVKMSVSPSLAADLEERGFVNELSFSPYDEDPASMFEKCIALTKILKYPDPLTVGPEEIDPTRARRTYEAGLEIIQFRPSFQ